MERRRLACVATTPEASGLTGCCQFLLVEREVLELNPKPAKAAAAQPAPPGSVPATPATVPTLEEHLYATSLTVAEHDPASLLEIVRGDWSAIENGTHYRRDVSYGEDRCRVAHRQAAAALASLRNLAIGTFELARDAGRTTATTLSAWNRQQTFTTAYEALQR